MDDDEVQCVDHVVKYHVAEVSWINPCNSIAPVLLIMLHFVLSNLSMLLTSPWLGPRKLVIKSDVPDSISKHIYLLMEIVTPFLNNT